MQEAITGDGGRAKRLYQLAEQRRLVDNAAGQAADLAALREEVDRLRMRTFPAFGRADPRLV